MTVPASGDGTEVPAPAHTGGGYLVSALAGAGWSDPALVIAGIMPIGLPEGGGAQGDLLAVHGDEHADSTNDPQGHDDYHVNTFADHNDHDDHDDQG
jgi:hypothetical protein